MQICKKGKHQANLHKKERQGQIEVCKICQNPIQDKYIGNKAQTDRQTDRQKEKTNASGDASCVHL